jgi:transcriptional regulator with XRE-family HTH domain
VTHHDTPARPPHPQDPALQRFGATLRAYRQQRGLTQPALAASTGIRRAYLSQIETGKRNIAVLTLLRLARALQIPAAWLVTPLDTRAPLPLLPASDALPSRGARDRGVTPPETSSPQQGDATTLLQLLGTTMRHYRQQQGLTHKALAVKTGLDKSYIGEIERGERNLSVLNVVRIADALGLSVSHLLAPLEILQSPSPPLPE